MNTEKTTSEKTAHRASGTAAGRYYRTGMTTYFLSGICSISMGVIVSLLQDHYGLSYGSMGTMVSASSIGNMLAVLLAGILPGRIGERRTTLLLSIGFFTGYLLMSLTGNPALLLAAFLMTGAARGLCTNKCTVLVGNYAPDRARGVALLNVWWSVGALLCPFLIAGFGLLGKALHTPFLMETAGLTAAGLLLWSLFARAGLPDGRFEGTQEEGVTTYAFLRQPVFWLLTLLILCNMGVENSVNGWLVSYYKSEKILSGTLSTYTVTIQWAAILAGRLMTAYVWKSKRIFRTTAIMSAAVLCTYLVMVTVRTPVPAILALIVYSFAVGGVFPKAVLGIGEMMSSESMGVMLSIAAAGAILFPSLVGAAADRFGLRAGMTVILIPAAGVVALSLLMDRLRAGA